jgi:hypothetical protein
MKLAHMLYQLPSFLAIIILSLSYYSHINRSMLIGIASPYLLVLTGLFFWLLILVPYDYFEKPR